MAKIQIQTCRFVSTTELFAGLKAADKTKTLIDAFAESGPDFSWGGNNRSLIDAEAILDHVQNMDEVSERTFNALQKRVLKLVKQGKFPNSAHLYVDLES